jgi:hypothetical protein
VYCITHQKEQEEKKEGEEREEQNKAIVSGKQILNPLWKISACKM